MTKNFMQAAILTLIFHIIMAISGHSVPTLSASAEITVEPVSGRGPLVANLPQLSQPGPPPIAQPDLAERSR